MGNTIRRVSQSKRPRTANTPVYHPRPGVSRQVHQLTEDEQMKIVQRIGLIQRLPTSKYVTKGVNECDICMVDYKTGDIVRYLPCTHFYHVQCIDEWLMRSFSCPHCMEPIETSLL